MSFSTCIEAICASISIHIILLSDTGRLRRKLSLIALILMIFVLVLSIFP